MRSRACRGGYLRLDGPIVRLAMASRGLDSRDLAYLAGVATSTLSGALHGRPITATTAARLGRALAATPVIEVPGLAHLGLLAPSSAPPPVGPPGDGEQP